MKQSIGRRNFLKMLGIGAGAAGATAVIKPLGGNTAFAHTPIPGAFPAPQQGGDDEEWKMMDQHHEEQMNAFMANIGKDDNFWRKPLEYTMDGDTKVFELTTSNIMWETAPDKILPAFAYNGMVPGPEIRATEGDRVRFILHNEMNQSTAIHWHGVDVPNDQDGVPFVTQPVVRPGETYVYEFVLPNSGSHMYHSHHNSLEQVVGGLLGAFVIEPKDKSNEPKVDKEYTMILNDSTLGFTINGKSFPYTQPVTAKVGEVVRIRYMNEGLMPHPMHLHGMPQQVIAKDGYYLPQPYMADTINVAPGERYDVLVTARAAGAWAFHCHVLSHVETRNGMFGMVTPFIITEA